MIAGCIIQLLVCILVCRSRLSFRLNRLPQNSQKYGISPVWDWMCLTRSLLLWNALLQYRHVWGI